MPTLTPHQQAISIIERLVIDNIGKTLEATANCNQCPEELKINLVEGIDDLQKEKRVGTVLPDLTLVNREGKPVRFIEVVDRHMPGNNVHEYALAHGIELVEVHLRAEKEFTGRRRNKALDAALTVKARLRELAGGRIQVDAHNLLCRKPPCKRCGAPLPLRTVAIRTIECWNCGKNVNVALWHQNGENLYWQNSFPVEEIEFAKANGVTLERRFSRTLGNKYLANVCPSCNEIQGDWFLHLDPYHNRFNLFGTEWREYGPCDKCAARRCPLHEEYLDYQETGQCPTCLDEATRVVCTNHPDRECFYPDRCQETGCYFVNREEQRLQERQERERQQHELRERQERRAGQEEEQRRQEWAEFNEWFRKQRDQ